MKTKSHGEEDFFDWFHYLKRNFEDDGDHTVPFPGTEWSFDESSDEKLRHQILKKFYLDKNLDASKIDVLVNQGAVSLTGFADSLYDIHKAEYIVRALQGVYLVNNDLKLTEQRLQ